MLITEKIKIPKKNSKEVKYYEKIGYSLIDEYMEINISDLKIYSSEIITAKCDFCDNVVEISYKNYNRNLSRGNKFSCCKKCSLFKTKESNLEKYGVDNVAKSMTFKEKTKKTNLEKYGVEYALLNDDIKRKTKKTNLEKYGVEYSSQNIDIKDKVKKTNLEKYGVECALLNEDIKSKVKKTNLEKYGVDNVLKSNQIKDKIKKTNLEKYGVENSMQSKIIKEKANKTILNRYGEIHQMYISDIKEKIKETNLNKYGVENPMQSTIIQNKTKQTNLKKYGCETTFKNEDIKNKSKKTILNKYNVEHPMQNSLIKNKAVQTNLNKYGAVTISQNEEFRKENFNIAKHKNYIKYIKNNISSFNCDCGKEHIFEIKSDMFIARKTSNNPLCTICYPISENNSIKELEVLKFIQENYKGIIIPGYRNGIEIDIYLPELKLGFEFNGLYWHSEEYKDKNYHLYKTNYFKEKDIRIIHIYEDDWNLRQNIIKSQIKNYLGLTEIKIFARKCQIKQLIDSSIFLENNHIQGKDKSIVKIGLYYNSELISLMTFDKFEGRKKMLNTEYNLSRFCNKLNYNIIGGASKLLNWFVKTYNPTRIISYADRSWSEGNLYFKLGFKLISESKPDYKYIINNQRIHKSNFKMLNEKNEMLNNGIKKIYDCGKLKFEK